MQGGADFGVYAWQAEVSRVAGEAISGKEREHAPRTTQGAVCSDLPALPRTVHHPRQREGTSEGCAILLYDVLVCLHSVAPRRAWIVQGWILSLLRTELARAGATGAKARQVHLPGLRQTAD